MSETASDHRPTVPDDGEKGASLSSTSLAAPAGAVHVGRRGLVIGTVLEWAFETRA
jgi:hypothetical protein